MKPKVWTADDAASLKQSRSVAGCDLPDLAKATCLSVAQLKQLEQGGESCFYTPAIKYLAGQRAMSALQQWQGRSTTPAQPPEATPSEGDSSST